MKTKTSELSGKALDWAVAVGEGYGGIALKERTSTDWYSPSTDWAQGGPIIEREVINTGSSLGAPTWYANKGLCVYHQFGKTPLVAAMRCYVASKLGDTVDVPEELL